MKARCETGARPNPRQRLPSSDWGVVNLAPPAWCRLHQPSPPVLTGGKRQATIERETQLNPPPSDVVHAQRVPIGNPLVIHTCREATISFQFVLTLTERKS